MAKHYCALFYFAETKLTESHQPVKLTRGRTVYIRAYERAEDASSALEKATPMEGETLLNTVDLTGGEAC
jgi:hypothetical protein